MSYFMENLHEFGETGVVRGHFPVADIGRGLFVVSRTNLRVDSAHYRHTNSCCVFGTVLYTTYGAL